ncbi:MAG TPA: hypothetical protein VEU62_16380 [Bryobacterales bacterium]|nr:hypothetical protein [Bryobacterales bacterium]
MSVRDVEDEIFRLRRLRFDPQIAAVLDEAQQALTAGRDLEAEALVEKAAALLRLSLKLAS